MEENVSLTYTPAKMVAVLSGVNKSLPVLFRLPEEDAWISYSAVDINDCGDFTRLAMDEEECGCGLRVGEFLDIAYKIGASLWDEPFLIDYVDDFAPDDDVWFGITDMSYSEEGSAIIVELGEAYDASGYAAWGEYIDEGEYLVEPAGAESAWSSGEIADFLYGCDDSVLDSPLLVLRGGWGGAEEQVTYTVRQNVNMMRIRLFAEGERQSGMTTLRPLLADLETCMRDGEEHPLWIIDPDDWKRGESVVDAYISGGSAVFVLADGAQDVLDERNAEMHRAHKRREKEYEKWYKAERRRREERDRDYWDDDDDGRRSRMGLSGSITATLLGAAAV